MGFAREVADEVCFLHKGQILERGRPDGGGPGVSVPRRAVGRAGGTW